MTKLPTIAPLVVHSVLAKYRDKSPKETFDLLKAELRGADNNLCELIEAMANTAKWCEPVEVAESVGVLVYHVLKSQLEADVLALSLAGRVA